MHATLLSMLAVCDPVLGDEGRLYVPADLVEAYKSEVLPIASVLVPNQVRRGGHVFIDPARVCLDLI